MAGLGFAQRLSKLGTETAYAVSDEAKALGATGVTIYPFHIGDLNFATPAIFSDSMNKAIAEKKTGYCPAAGIAPLRQSLAEGVGKARGVTYTAENVSVQSGGKPVILKFLMSVMNEGDEVLYPTPGYPIYESVIKFLGGVPVPYEYEETSNGFKLRVDQLTTLVTPKTRVLLFNNLQNPLGVSSTPEEMAAIAKFAVQHDLWVLSDEAYFDIVFEAEQKSIVALPGMLERTCILFTFSKSWSMTGWRLGAAIGPARLITHINKLNTNDEACTTHFIQWAGLSWQTPEAKQFVAELVAELKRRRDALVPLINKIPGFKCSAPPATFYLFANVTEAMKLTKSESVEAFRKLILKETGVAVCHREHFGSALPHEVQRYVRFAYSGISIAQIEEATAKLRAFMEKHAH